MYRRATIFADDIALLNQNTVKKTVSDLKKNEKLEILELRTVGKTVLNETVGGFSHYQQLKRFLIHFLFVEHDHKIIDLF